MRSHRSKWKIRKHEQYKHLNSRIGYWRKEVMKALVLRDISYNTVRYGFVTAWDGEALELRAKQGWVLRVGHRPTGTAGWLDKHGYVSEIKESEDPDFWERVARRAMPYHEGTEKFNTLVNRLKRNS